MPKQTRIAYARLNTYEDLDKMLTDLRQQERLTMSQYISAKTMLTRYIPTMMKVYQRLPKSVTYFETGKHERVKMTNRAKVYTAVSSAESSVVSSAELDDGDA